MFDYRRAISPDICLPGTFGLAVARAFTGSIEAVGFGNEAGHKNSLKHEPLFNGFVMLNK